MKYIIETIPNEQMRYPTCGDYFTGPDGTEHIVVSDMGNDDYAFLVMIHEFAEQYLTKRRGITEESITAFDEEFERNRPEGNVDEPGDDPQAPYQNEHCLATAIERMMAAALGVKWQEYDNAISEL